MELPDLSRPPPNFIQNNFSLPPAQPDIADDLMPSLPYYELPAGLMVPLVKVCISNIINCSIMIYLYNNISFSWKIAIINL